VDLHAPRPCHPPRETPAPASACGRVRNTSP
jgi:hypothetical protein